MFPWLQYREARLVRCRCDNTHDCMESWRKLLLVLMIPMLMLRDHQRWWQWFRCAQKDPMIPSTRGKRSDLLLFQPFRQRVEGIIWYSTPNFDPGVWCGAIYKLEKPNVSNILFQILRAASYFCVGCSSSAVTITSAVSRKLAAIYRRGRIMVIDSTHHHHNNA